MKRARCAWVGAMIVSVVLLPALGALASIQYAATEENLRVLAETDKNLAVVQQLLDRGVNPNAVDWRGRTAVHVAARHGAAKNLHAILQAGGAPNVQDQDGSTPLHVAIREGERNGKVNVVKALLAGRADPCIQDAKGHTPYHVSSDQDEVRREIDRSRGHARACDDQPEANQATSAASTNVGQAENVIGDPWGADGGTYQDVWNRTLPTEADPWGVSDMPWSQDNRFADGLTDDESAEEADADYTAALEAAMGEAAEQETQEGDYVAALTQLERAAEERRQAELARQRAEAEERRQAELARQRAEAEERRQAELARQRAEAEERRQAAEREAEREREEAEEEAEWERQQAAWEEQEERERQQHQEAMNRMTRQIQERTNRMQAAMQAARQRGEDPRRALGDQLLREQGLGEIVERRRREEERRQQEAKQRQEEYNRQAARQQEEYERQRQEAERKAEQRRREAERERERQRQAQAEQRRQAQLRAKLKSAVATQCIQTRREKRTIVTKRGKIGSDNGRIKIRNGCSRSINIKGICRDGKGITKHQILGGTVFIPYSGLGLHTLRPGPWKPSEWAQVCADKGYRFEQIACTVPYTPYYTTSDASRYRCFE